MAKILKFKKISLVLVLLLALSLFAPSALAAGRELVPVGSAIGITIETDGVIVAGFTDDEDSPSASAGIMPGDIIAKIDGIPVSSSSDIARIVSALDGSTIQITVLRQEQEKTFDVTPLICDNGSAVLGLWLRDGLTGIGTVTYFDPKTGEFGALGHGVTDADTGILIPVKNGIVTKADVTSIIKGRCGAPGQLTGAFDFSSAYGNIIANTVCGVYGTLSRALPDLSPTTLPAAYNTEVYPGSAAILSDVGENGVQEYSIEILRVYDGSPEGRDMMIKVTDPRLLDLTGGIVQGMSGSPIIQDGKLVGAVTHVLVNDPTRGYGIFIENMLDAAS